MLTTIMTRDTESKNVLFPIRTVACHEQVDMVAGDLHGAAWRKKSVTFSSVTARSRKRSSTRFFLQVAPQVNWQTYVDSSNRQMLRVSGRYAATARSKSIAMCLTFDTEAWIHLSQANAWPIARYRIAVRSEQHRQGKKRGNPHCDHSFVQ